MTSEPFLKPRLIGSRFEGGVIPLEVLADFAVLEEMIVEVAKWKFLEANPQRKRVPPGFTDGVTLKLAGIEDGSAKLLINLTLSAATLFSQSYFENARSAFIGAITAAGQGSSITSFLPQKLLGYFDRFGRNLGEGEVIEFQDNAGQPATRLNKEIRRKLVLASEVNEVTDVIVCLGSIPEMDQQAKTFHLRLLDGAKVKAPLSPQHFDSVMEAFTNYRQNQRVRMVASGRFNRENRLLGFDSVEHISILDPLDLGAQLDEFKLLKDGWLDGKGFAPNHSGLDWLLEATNQFYPEDLPPPYLYPTPEGGVQAEWSLDPWEISIEINLDARVGNWHALNMSDDTEQIKTLHFDSPSDWQWLNDEIRRLAEANA